MRQFEIIYATDCNNQDTILRQHETYHEALVDAVRELEGHEIISITDVTVTEDAYMEWLDQKFSSSLAISDKFTKGILHSTYCIDGIADEDRPISGGDLVEDVCRLANELGLSPQHFHKPTEL